MTGSKKSFTVALVQHAPIFLNLATSGRRGKADQ